MTGVSSISSDDETLQQDHVGTRTPMRPICHWSGSVSVIYMVIQIHACINEAGNLQTIIVVQKLWRPCNVASGRNVVGVFRFLHSIVQSCICLSCSAGKELHSPEHAAPVFQTPDWPVP